MAFNMDPKKCPMPTQDPNVRNKNFKEVALGYTAEMAVNEAKRCIGCKNKPCQSGCPVGIDIPEFIAHVAEGDFEAAYQVINRSSSLPAVCGRVCPQESQCEGKCTRGRWLRNYGCFAERYVQRLCDRTQRIKDRRQSRNQDGKEGR